MAAEKGLAMVLKVGNGATSETFTTVGGMRATSISFNSETVDVTDKDSAGWKQLLAAAGIKSMSITGSGVFKDSASEATVRTNALAQTINNYQVVFQDNDKFQGPFQITAMEYSGEYNGARTYSLTLESAGAIVHTP